jgi:hypothetical protein
MFIYCRHKATAAKLIAIGNSGGLLLTQQSNKPLGYIKDGEFLDKLSNYQLLDDSAPWSYMYYVTVVCSMSQPFLRKSMK